MHTNPPFFSNPGLAAMRWGMITLALIVLVLPASPQAGKSKDEYFIKAGLVMRFLKFVDWPEESHRDRIVIGVVGRDTGIVELFERLIEKRGKHKIIRGKELVIQDFGRFKKDLTFDGCDLLFIGSTEKRHLEKILKLLDQSQVLTISEIDGFLETGGMINLKLEKEKVIYEINQTQARKHGLRVSSHLLGRATRVL